MNTPAFSLPFNWKVPAGRALELALNRALALDADTRAGLAALDGQRVALYLATPPLALQIRVQGERLTVGPVTENPGLSVRTSLGALLQQVPGLRREGAAPIGQLRIEGDAALAQRLQKLAAGFDPDWGLPLTQVFGEVLGVQIANAIAFALRRARHAGSELAASTAEWLTEESGSVVGREELAAFHEDVDTLRDDVERLADRITRLKGAA